MSQTASQRPKKVVLAVAVVLVIAVAAFAAWRLTGNDDAADPLATATTTTTTTTTATPSAEATTKGSPKPSKAPKCEGPDTQFNVEGVEQDSLLPDCGAVPVTRDEQKKAGLGLACGGSYPVILFKTTTSDASTSICGKDSSGQSFRFVTQPKGGKALDVPGSYDPANDFFVASKDGTKYAVEAYTGDLLVSKNGKTTRQKSDGDWISLDNESDYD